MIELLVVIAIIAILAALLFPVFSSAKQTAWDDQCISNLRQIGVAFEMYVSDNDSRMPDRQDLKAIEYKPWTSWPTSDPRSGWIVTLLSGYAKSSDIWSCHSVQYSKMGNAIQVKQGVSRYWMWRFDQAFTRPLDDFWGKSEEQTIPDLREANNPNAGIPDGTADIELAVDPYFPKTVPTVSPELKGIAVHRGGRMRLFLDGHVKLFRDARLNP